MNPSSQCQDHELFSRTIECRNGPSFLGFTYCTPTLIKCNVCSVSVTGIANALNHAKGKKHLHQLQSKGLREVSGSHTTPNEPPVKKAKFEPQVPVKPNNGVKPGPVQASAAKTVAVPVAVKPATAPVVVTNPQAVAKSVPVTTAPVTKPVTASPAPVAKPVPVTPAPVAKPVPVTTPATALKPVVQATNPPKAAVNPAAAPTKNPAPAPRTEAANTPANKLPETVVKLLSIQKDLFKDEPQLTSTIPLRLPVKQPAAQQKRPDPAQRMASAQEPLLNLENNTEPLIGLEYLVELQLYDNEPRYHCVLCDKMGDPRTIIIHLTSTAHRMKYFDKHFPSMMKELGELRYDKEARVAVIKVLEEVASAVEKYHGRMPPLVVEDGQYKEHRMRFLQQILNGKHFSEFVGPSFVQLVDKKKIANITRTVKLKADVQRTVAEVEAAQRGRDVEPGSPRRRSLRSRSRSGSPRRNRHASDRRRRSRSAERRPVDAEKLHKYSTMKVTAVKEVESRYQEYELHPEKHPLYPAEWEAFWNRRYKELQAEGKDASAHDFKPEWIAFWIRRLKELFNADVDAAKRDIKIKLGLSPQDSPSRSNSVDSVPRARERERERDRKRPSSIEHWSGDDRESSKRNRRDRSPSESSRGRGGGGGGGAPNRRGSRSPSRSTVQSKRRLSRSPSLDRRERIRELDRIISQLPGSSRSGGEYGRGGDYGYEYDYRYAAGGRDRDRDRDRYRGPAPAYDRDETTSSAGGAVVVIDDDDDDEPVTVVNVLRILAALEEQLGSMGTKTLEMLAKALAMEKAKANSSDDLLMTDNNAVFFETIKEKLKGQLITGVLGKSKVNAVKKAIRKIAEILHEITKKVAEAERAEKEAESSKRTIVIKVNMDKSMIAQRIALALVTEKKTDVTPEQLEILINVFFEMLRKSKELNKMVTTQDYIELLEEQKVQSVAEKVDILGIIGKRETHSSPVIPGRNKPDKPVVRLNYEDEPSEGGGVAEKLLSIRKVNEENIFGEADEEEALLMGAQGGSGGDGFTDSDLQTLLVNFKDLSSDEQQHLIKHLKRLEAEAPDRVEKLRKFVNFEGMGGGRGVRRSDGNGRAPLSMSEELSKRRNRWGDASTTATASPVVGGGEGRSASALGPVPVPEGSVINPASRGGGALVVVEEEAEKERVKFDMKRREQPIQPMAGLLDDDDDDDYSYDDLVKAASKNLESQGGSGRSGAREAERATEKNGKDIGGGGGGVGGREGAEGGSRAKKERSVSPETKRISETHSLIANIMGSLQKKVAGAAAAAAPSSSAAPGLSPAGGSATSASTASGGKGQGSSNKGGGVSGAAAGATNAASLPFYQQQNSNYKSTYQEQIVQQQQFVQYQQMQGGYDQLQQQMMYNQQQQQQHQQPGNGQQGQWWPQNQQQQMFNPQQQQQQQFYGNNSYGGPNHQYPNNGQNNNYGNYY